MINGSERDRGDTILQLKIFFFFNSVSPFQLSFFMTGEALSKLKMHELSLGNLYQHIIKEKWTKSSFTAIVFRRPDSRGTYWCTRKE